ncbi:hypothetical protein WISP_110906 [Willisornis vidua]|uniref:Uncharacterized protein n=1 Tax=Willisornis vidua TaxID=1566151 RepID=A0ABQ9CVS6_9PASS|nr:hypothetical protein WISP_110906 [Willisornis vidua]
MLEAGRAFGCSSQPPKDAHMSQHMGPATSPTFKEPPGTSPATAEASHPSDWSITQKKVGSAEKWGSFWSNVQCQTDRRRHYIALSPGRSMITE